MDAIREAIQSLNLQPDFFTGVIFMLIGMGSVWAVRRLYFDYTHPFADERFKRPTIKLTQQDKEP